ncbi:MAG: lysine--tRNA ligase [Candidatus Pacebacteria bacterium]|nr:lysine--tRNA ligase [Candidatus Paceibacterota bacterium]
MASLEEIREQRLKKLKRLQEEGIEPYPISSRKTHTIAAVLDIFGKLQTDKKPVVLAGRLMAKRGQGAIIFFDLFDGTDKIQGVLKEDSTKDFKLFSEILDIGDFIEVKGTLFTTKRGEKSIEAREARMLTKSLRPLPEKYHGLQDMEERFRRRYLDLLTSEETRERFKTRFAITRAIRKFLDKKGFQEVETPILQPIAGGANAMPFKTHHNFLDIDLYLRIAQEIYLKELLIGGLPKVYEIGRNFRNEGIDVTHNPEFTTVELYESFSDATKFRRVIESLSKIIVKEVYGGTRVSYNGNEIDFEKKFATVQYLKLFKEKINFEAQKATYEKTVAKAKELGVVISEGDSKEKLLDGIYKKAIRPSLIQPTFVTDYPVQYLPLAKRISKNRELADAFQLVVGGLELAKAFSELNDPLDQRERFNLEEKNKQRGDKEAQTYDKEFVEALEYGMPPAAGAGLSIDRFTMLLTDTKNIREVILFPTLRPRS